MRYAIFSDIHSNLEAYKASLEVMLNEKVDQYICLGDIVGYGANPKECISLTQELIKEKGCICIAGNHDAAAAEMIPVSLFNPLAQEAIVWTKKIIDQNENEFLSTLPLLKSERDCVFVHASLDKPQEWQYVYTIDEAYKNFELFKEKACFIGHSHIPVIFKGGKNFEYFVSPSIKIEEGFRYIVNAGSIGQPRDHDPRACFLIYDTEKCTFEYKRVQYDIAGAQTKIRKAGLPEMEAMRLAIGE
ncbi:MAG: metallophosphoesterase family protein [Candidatus Omnitrophica bacterium]|nr:metallophosphoesterase family protein [Candidatus Omnitrophota bacterium]